MKDQSYQLEHWCILCRTYFENQFYDLALIFLDIFGAQMPSEMAKKKMVENVTNKDFFVILKLDLNALECNFLRVIHGPKNCMKWMKNALRCWNLCFLRIAWCFKPVDTIHLFLWEKIAPLGCGVMASLWVQTTNFGVCICLYLYIFNGRTTSGTLTVGMCATYWLVT